jgi:subtilase family serine protease
MLATPVTGAVSAQPNLDKPHKKVCGSMAPGSVRCHAEVVTNANTGQPQATQSYTSGLTPAQLHAAYALPSLPAAGTNFTWNGQTIAIVDAYDNPNAATDLLAYRQQFKLPLCATTAAQPTVNDLVGCLFQKVNQAGSTVSYPAGNAAWGQEIDLDIQMASAICPGCKVLLVEANTNSYDDLVIAVDRAALMGANVISNSYGSTEFSGETSYNTHFNHPGIAITASSGDNGYGATFPAASQYVTAVGGTSLTPSATARGWTESAWYGAGSGCSAYIARPSWQPTIGTCTNNRIIADVSAVADPSTGVAVYDSYGSGIDGNWMVFGGTSVAAPIIASVYALAGNSGGNAPAIKYGEYPYTHKTALYDITGGSNGNCVATKKLAKNAPLCTASSGFDGPTGLGSPRGTLAF